MREILLASGVEDFPNNMIEDMVALPFLMVDTRTDVSITFNAVKIYPEQIKAGIMDPSSIPLFLFSLFLPIKKFTFIQNLIYPWLSFESSKAHEIFLLAS